jgi:hypothetical protein
MASSRGSGWKVENENNTTLKTKGDHLKGKVESNEPTSLPESWTTPISGLAGWFD